MRHIRRSLGLAFVVLLGAVVMTGGAAPQRKMPEQLPHPDAPRFVPKFEALAETKLLMDGLTQSNYNALEKHLQGKGPQDGDTWAFARGQALLIAETGNLLLLRPPRNEGRDTWMRRASDMRQSAANLAHRLKNRDLIRSRDTLTDLANKCNNCHQSFRVPARIGPKAEPAPAARGGVRDTE
jgi:hypothetical protein